jgi:hypothetical protein
MFDVDYPTGGPHDGQVLTWDNIVHQWLPKDATGGAGGGARRLGQLDDVEDGTGTPTQGAFLRWIDGVWQAEPAANLFIPRTLGQLDDVENGTGTPVQGSFLRYVDGIWQAEPAQNPFIPLRLGQLNDVEDSTGTPVQGAFLRWIDGVWQADPAQNLPIPRRLGQLNDVEDGTGTPNQGAFLRWIDGVWQADPAQNLPIPRRLGQLDDVEDGTGTPAQGSILRWIDGVWQADPAQNLPIPRRLGQLDDVEDGTGTPTAGSYLRFIDGVWQADPAASTGSGGAAPSRMQVKIVSTATYTLTNDDLYKFLIFTNAAAITVTVPNDATGNWSSVIGTTITPVFALQQGPTAGQITVAPGAGVNVNTLSIFSLKSYGPNAVLQLVQTAGDTYTLFGAQSA